jgi:phosphoenolpyruvate phosphomutase
MNSTPRTGASAAARLRDAFARPGLIRAAGAHNALGARLAQRAGFDAIWSSGLEISASHAVPDANILSMSELLLTARGMVDAVTAPVIADCDTGFGNVNNVIHMVRRFEGAGVAAVCIEDKRFPKVNSFVAGRHDLSSIAEFAGKIMAAKSTQRDPDFMVLARVEALIAGAGMEEALRRAEAYAEAGADAVLIHSKSPLPNEILEFMRRWSGRAPVVVVPTTYYGVSGRELEEAGVKMAIYANHGLRASVAAMEQVFAEILAHDSSREVEARIAPLAQIFELQGIPALRDAESRFLRPGEGPVRAVVLAAGAHPTLGAMTAETPLSMLDVNGRTLLARQAAVLGTADISSLSVVAGYRADQVWCEGVLKIENRAWDRTGELGSLACVVAPWDGRTLVAYGDVLFERDIVARLLESRADVTVVVDVTYDPRRHQPERATDRVVLDGRRRALSARRVKRMVGVSPPEADCEFVGLALFSAEAFGRLGRGPSGRLPDALQAMIDEGVEVACVEVARGWTEIRTIEDYALACSLLAGPP